MPSLITTSFATPLETSSTTSSTNDDAMSSIDAVVVDEDEDVTCYVTNDVEVISEGERPHVVCTSEPEE